MSEINVKFFVEGKADQKFITDLVAQHFNYNLSPEKDFVRLNSWSGYKNATPKFKEYSENGYKNILLIDNDVVGRRLEVRADIQNLNISVELFLFPNDSNVGELESLLANLAVERGIIECFEKYEVCIANYESVDLKGKIYAYMDALIPNAEKKRDEKIIKDQLRWDYRNQAHWDLNSPALEPLLAFLRAHIIIS